uniref:ribosomal protein S10 n=1 Tax=Meteora sporadica TaxID=2913902 RepID=UPI0030015DFA|nr:ribosomal protein S10 [Meteora sporadica]
MNNQIKKKTIINENTVKLTIFLSSYSDKKLNQCDLLFKKSMFTLLKKVYLYKGIKLTKLPTLEKELVVLRSPHVNKKAREKYNLLTFKRAYTISLPKKLTKHNVDLNIIKHVAPFIILPGIKYKFKEYKKLSLISSV